MARSGEDTFRLKIVDEASGSAKMTIVGADCTWRALKETACQKLGLAQTGSSELLFLWDGGWAQGTHGAAQCRITRAQAVRRQSRQS